MLIYNIKDLNKMAVVNTLDYINYIINISTFSMSVLFQGAFLIRFKGKADKAALAILFNYLFVNGFRIFTPKMLYSKWDLLISPLSNGIIYSILFFFVFEMSYLRAFFKKTVHNHYVEEKRLITL